MPALTIKGLPEELLDRLREAAEANRRSLNREVIDRLERSVGSGPIDPDALLARADAVRERLALRPLRDAAISRAKRAGRT